jgi:hypothetical protein
MKSPIQYVIAYHGNLASGCSQRIYSSIAFLHLGEEIIRIRDIWKHLTARATQYS